MSRKIEITNLDIKYADALTEIATNNYELERIHVPELPDFNHLFYYERLKELLQSGIGRIAIQNEEVVGYLLFERIFDTGNGNEKGATSPIYGYGVKEHNRGEVICRLFQDVAKELCENYVSSLRVNLYANDKEVLSTYIMSSFAMDVTEVIRNTDDSIVTEQFDEIEFRELSKSELLVYRKDVIELYRSLINHLRVSPVFYHCKYFLPIEDRFEDFLGDDMKFFAVFHNDFLVGMIDSEKMELLQYTKGINPISLGDILLKEDYRGRGIAKGLLKYANDALKESGYDRIFVMHGTINPTARGFWGKYFKNFTYTLTRKIDPEMLGVIESV